MIAINVIYKDSRHGSRESLNDVEDYYFFVNRWFAKDEDDRQIVRELTPTDADGRPLANLEGSSTLAEKKIISAN